MTEVDNPNTPETLNLQKGLNAVYMPELRIPNTDKFYLGRDWTPGTPESTLVKLQSFLDEIDKQGGEVLGIVPVEVDAGNPPRQSDHDTEDKLIFIIRKK